MKKVLILIFVLVLLSFNVLAQDSITISGQLIDAVTKEPIADAQLQTAAKINSESVSTDENGNFNFEVFTPFRMQANSEPLESAVIYFYKGGSSTYLVINQVDGNYEYELTNSFDQTQDKKVDSAMDLILELYPQRDFKFISDKVVSVEINYHSKTVEGLTNGAGNSAFKKEHTVSGIIPLDYDLFAVLKDEDGNEFKSEIYHTSPTVAETDKFYLKYVNNNFEWSILKEGQDIQGDVEQYGDQYQLKKGWNLITIALFESLRGQVTLYGKSYLFDPLNKKYVPLIEHSEEVEQLIGVVGPMYGGDDYYLAGVPLWFYSSKDVKISDNGLNELRRPNDKNKEKLGFMTAGWNLVTYTGALTGKSFNDIKGDCEIMRVNFFDANTQSWQTVDVLETFNDDAYIGHGFSVKVQNQCKFDYLNSGNGNIPSPPPLPN